jgi:hypothetical protein
MYFLSEFSSCCFQARIGAAPMADQERGGRGVLATGLESENGTRVPNTLPVGESFQKRLSKYPLATAENQQLVGRCPIVPQTTAFETIHLD